MPRTVFKGEATADRDLWYEVKGNYIFLRIPSIDAGGAQARCVRCVVGEELAV